MITPYYDQDGITIYCGDCLEIMPQLEGPFDAIIADLPYGTTACDWDSVIPLELLWKEYKRLVKNNGAIVLFGSQPFTSKLVMSNLEWFKYEWIWDKVAPTGHLNAPKKPLLQHENVLLFSQGSLGNFIYNPEMRIGRYRNKSPKRSTDLTEGRVYGQVNHSKNNYNDTYYPTSIIEVSHGNKTNVLHPTQKPLDLLRYLVRTYTNPGDLILDNTMGSGTTLVAAQIEGRRAIGIDILEDYCQIAVDRLKPPGFLSLLAESVETPEQLTLIPEGESS